MHVGMVLLSSFVLLGVLELAIGYVRQLWAIRVYISVFLLAAVALVSFLAFLSFPSVVATLLLVTGFYRAVNLLRIVRGRMQPEYLLRVFRRSALILVIAQTTLAIAVVGQLAIGLPALPWVAAVQVLAALGILTSTLINIRASHVAVSNTSHAQRDLPTLTVAIPARNETDDLIDCLHSVLASTYPKLEVVVLDDCSQTNTSAIIKQFAHDGVRFIPGRPPQETWLAKNQAYQTLTEHASGDIMLFCGVDIRFEPQSITTMVEAMLGNKLQMLNVLPYRPGFTARTQLLQPLRYWWELAMPRFAMKQPPSLSTCWLIGRKTVQELGGFAAVRRRMRPETYFARTCQQRQAYKFSVDSQLLGVTNLKRPSEQFQTALRVRYPELHKRPESVCTLSLIELGVFALPFLQIPFGIYTGRLWLTAASVISACLLVATHQVIMRLTSRHGTLVGLVNYPLVALAELYIINRSMMQYEFGSIDWKGRNICLPVMHVTRHLPRLSDDPHTGTS